jgi:hypothetical protein
LVREAAAAAATFIASLHWLLGESTRRNSPESPVLPVPRLINGKSIVVAFSRHRLLPDYEFAMHRLLLYKEKHAAWFRLLNDRHLVPAKEG